MWWRGYFKNRVFGERSEKSGFREKVVGSREIAVGVPVAFPTQIEAFWKSERFKRSLYRTRRGRIQPQILWFAKKANTSGGGQRWEWAWA